MINQPGLCKMKVMKVMKDMQKGANGLKLVMMLVPQTKMTGLVFIT